MPVYFKVKSVTCFSLTSFQKPSFCVPAASHVRNRKLSLIIYFKCFQELSVCQAYLSLHTYNFSGHIEVLLNDLLGTVGHGESTEFFMHLLSSLPLSPSLCLVSVTALVVYKHSTFLSHLSPSPVTLEQAWAFLLPIFLV